MSKFVESYCNYFHKIIWSRNTNGLWFHTARSSVLPNFVLKDNYTIDYLQCLRPAEVPVADTRTLAGDPRTPGRDGPGIQPEVFEKWNRRPKTPNSKTWPRCSWWGRPFQ